MSKSKMCKLIEELIQKPIPHLELGDWQNVKIMECTEPLVSLTKYPIKKILVEPQYYLRKVPCSIEECYVREGVYNLLIKASKILPSSYSVVIWDAWRPLEVQQHLFNNYFFQLHSHNPDYSDAALEEMANKFVSVPSDDATKPSPHNTGGAIDLTIAVTHGKVLEMGTGYDDFSEKSHTRYYEELETNGVQLANSEEKIKNNRRILYFTLLEAGFSNYPLEWWHYDYGNQFWGKFNHKDAFYGMISPKSRVC